MWAPSCTPVAALQGEVGCSSMWARDMKGKLKFAKFVMDSENHVLRRVFEGMRGQTRQGAWMKQVGGYLSEVSFHVSEGGEQ